MCSSDLGAKAQVWMANMQPKYWAAAGTLVVLLTVTLLFWDTAPIETESTPIAVAVTPTNARTDAVAAQDGLVAVPGQATLVAAVVEEADATSSEAVAPQEPGTSLAAAVEVESAETVVSSSSPAPKIVSPAAETMPNAGTIEVQETAVLAKASPFVERLLEASPQYYAVQLLASHSEANISKFVAELGDDQPAGYFETRFQGKPWFVAVLAVFEDRAQASRAIDSMPVKLRSNEPWTRSVAGIQTDIRELLGSKLVSSK